MKIALNFRSFNHLLTPEAQDSFGGYDYLTFFGFDGSNRAFQDISGLIASFLILDRETDVSSVSSTTDG